MDRVREMFGGIGAGLIFQLAEQKLNDFSVAG